MLSALADSAQHPTIAVDGRGTVYAFYEVGLNGGDLGYNWSSGNYAWSAETLLVFGVGQSQSAVRRRGARSRSPSGLVGQSRREMRRSTISISTARNGMRTYGSPILLGAPSTRRSRWTTAPTSM